MSATARLRAGSTRGWILRAFVAAACLCSAAPAAAQVGAAVSIFSESRFRGYSLSAGRPVAVLDFAYDDPSGIYGAVSTSAALGANDSVEPLGLQVNGGYAKRLSSELTLDLGVIHSRYSKYSSSASASSYTELYAGISRKYLSARIAFSPHYFEHGAETFYGELNGTVSPLYKVHLQAHAGLLVPVNYGDGSENSRTQYDWRLGLTHELGRLSLHAAVTGGGPGHDYYRGRRHSRNALVLGISCAI